MDTRIYIYIYIYKHTSNPWESNHRDGPRGHKKYPYDCFVCVCYKKLTTYTAKVHKSQYKKNIIKFTKNSFVAACMNEIKSDHHSRNPADSADVIAASTVQCLDSNSFQTR